MKFSVVALVLALATVSNAVTFQDCGGFAGKLIELQVPGCDDNETACSFKLNETINISATFLTAAPSKTSEATLQYEDEGSMVPLGKGAIDACKEGTLDCPLRPYQVYTVKLNTTIEKAEEKTVLRVRLIDENNNAFFCRQFPAEVAK